jgi:hypothetical protein
MVVVSVSFSSSLKRQFTDCSAQPEDEMCTPSSQNVISEFRDLPTQTLKTSEMYVHSNIRSN